MFLKLTGLENVIVNLAKRLDLQKRGSYIKYTAVTESILSFGENYRPLDWNSTVCDNGIRSIGGRTLHWNIHFVLRHIRVQHKLDWNGLSRVGIHESKTLSHVNFSTSTEFHNVKCFTPMCFLTLTLDQPFQSNMFEPKTNVHSLMCRPL